MAKRITALLICVLMCFSVIGTAFAEETGQNENQLEILINNETGQQNEADVQEERTDSAEKAEMEVLDEIAQQDDDLEKTVPAGEGPYEESGIPDQGVKEENSIDVDETAETEQPAGEQQENETAVMLEEIPEEPEESQSEETTDQQEPVEEEKDPEEEKEPAKEDEDCGEVDPDALRLGDLEGPAPNIGFRAERLTELDPQTTYTISNFKFMVADGSEYYIPLADSNWNELSGRIVDCWSSDTAVVSLSIRNGKCYATSHKAGIVSLAVASNQHVTYYETVISCFTDVANQSDYFFWPVYWALNNGITSGKTPTTFGPGQGCTRAHIVQFLYVFAGRPNIPGYQTNVFTDVSSNDYFYNAVRWAYANGITSGKTATTFAPSQVCTREQCMTFLWRYFGSPNVAVGNQFYDVPSYEYYAKPVYWALNNGITSGKSYYFFGTGEKCTRGQIVTFLWHADGHVEDVDIKYRALLIGQSDYYGTGDDLPGCSNDVWSMQGLLTGLNNRFTVTLRENRSANQILSDIQTAFAGATSDDVSLFYYSGHGCSPYDNYGYWADTTNTYVGALCGVDDELVTTGQLANALSRIPGRVIVILDSCYSGAAITPMSIGGDEDGFDLEAINQMIVEAFASYDAPAVSDELAAQSNELATGKFVVITAASAYQESAAGVYDGYPGSRFTYYFLGGMGCSYPYGSYRGSMPADSNRDQLVTLGEIYTYTRNKVTGHTVTRYGDTGEVLFMR